MLTLLSLVLCLGTGFGSAKAVRHAPFALIATQRTGSQWVMKTLRKEFCDVDASPEIFTADDKWNATGQRAALRLLFDPSAPASGLDALPFQFRRDVERSRGYKRATAYGFKWMLNQGVDDIWESFLRLCLARGARLVFLRRRDLLRMYVSYRSMRGAAHPETAAAAAAVPRVRLPTGATLLARLADYEARFAHMGALAARAEASGVPTATVVYEDLSANHSRFDALRTFLTADLAPRTCADPPTTPANLTVRIHGAHPSAYVKNWPDVYATLANSSYRAFLLEAEGGAAA